MLTPNQREVAQKIVADIRANKIDETFTIFWGAKVSGNNLHEANLNQTVMYSYRKIRLQRKIDNGAFHILVADGYLDITEIDEVVPLPPRITFLKADVTVHRCTVRQMLFEAVDSNFRDPDQVTQHTEAAYPQPPEIMASLKRLHQKFPASKPLGFLIMRFASAKPFENLVSVIKTTGKKLGVAIIRADDNEFHADLWGNVRTLLHACSFGIAVYERIQSDEPNANVGLEVGYLMAMNKPVLLLKDKTLTNLQTDLVGKLYRLFDPHDPEHTVPEQLEAWLKDNGIAV